jgi:hypothetical protein
MGLDMYLTKKTYVGGNYEFNKVEGDVRLNVRGNDLPVKLNRLTYVIEDVGYWRKANQIHKWFVDNVQGGVDDCSKYEVDVEKLKELLKICKKVKKDHSLAEKLLPTQSGFFFGGTSYDEYYFYDIDTTIKILTPLLKELKAQPELIYSYIEYQSSW